MSIINSFQLLEDVESEDTSVVLEKKAAKLQAQARSDAEKEDALRMLSGKYYQPAHDFGKGNEDPLNVRSAGGRSVSESRRGFLETSYDKHSGTRGNARDFSGGYNNYKEGSVNNSVGSGHGNYDGYNNVDFGHQSSKGNKFSGPDDELHVSTMLSLQDGYGTMSIGVDSPTVTQLHKKAGRSLKNSGRKWYAEDPNKRQKERITVDDAGDDMYDVSSDEGSLELTKAAATEDDVVIPKKQVEENESLDSVQNKGKDQPDKKKDESPVSDAIKDREADAKLMTLAEYEKLMKEKRKSLLANKTIEERKIPVDKAFESMKQLSIRKETDDEISTKAASAKAVNQKQGNAGKVKKTLNVNEVLMVTRESSYRYSSRYLQRDQSSPAVSSDGNQGSAHGGYSGGYGQGLGRDDNTQSFRGRGDNVRSAGGRSVPESRRGSFETSYDKHSGTHGNARGFSGGYNSYMEGSVKKSVGSGHGNYDGYNNVDSGHQRTKGNKFCGPDDELHVSTMLSLQDGYGTMSIGVDSPTVTRLHKKAGRSLKNSGRKWYEEDPNKHRKERITIDDVDDDTYDVLSDEDSLELTKAATTEDDVVIPKKKVEEHESLDSVQNMGKDQPYKKDESPVSDAIKDKEADAKLTTLAEYEKLMKEKRKSLLANKTIEERKIPVDKAFESMKQLSIRKETDDEISTKAASAKAVNQKQGNAGKVKKTLNVNEVLMVTRESSYRYSSRYLQRDQSSPAVSSDGNQGSAHGGYSGGYGQGRGRDDNTQSFRGRGDNVRSAGGRSVPESRRGSFETSYDKHSGTRGNARGFSGGYNSYMEGSVKNSVGSGHGNYDGYNNVDSGHQRTKGNKFCGPDDELHVSTMLSLQDGYGTMSIGMDSPTVTKLHKKAGRSLKNSGRKWYEEDPNKRRKERITIDDADDDMYDVLSDEDSLELIKAATTEDDVVIPKKQVEEHESLDSVQNKGKDQPDKKKDESPVSDAIKDREADAKLMTLAEYKKLMKEKRKFLLRLRTKGTTIIIVMYINEIHVYVDARETMYKNKYDTFIVQERRKKYEIFDDRIFAVYMGDVVIGRQVLEHLRTETKKMKNPTVKKVALCAYKHFPKGNDVCDVFIGGFLPNQKVRLYKVCFSYTKDVMNRRQSLKPLNEKKPLTLGSGSQEANLVLFDAEGRCDVSKCNEAMTLASMRTISTGGYISGIILRRNGPKDVKKTRTISCVIDHYNTLFQESHVFMFYNRLTQNQDYFTSWMRSMRIRGLQPFVVGSPICHVKNLDLAFGTGFINDKNSMRRSFDSGRRRIDILHGFEIMEFNYQKKIFYLARPCLELLKSLKVKIFDDFDIAWDFAQGHKDMIINMNDEKDVEMGDESDDDFDENDEEEGDDSDDDPDEKDDEEMSDASYDDLLSCSDSDIDGD